jgi:hypothetical protein
VSEWAENERLRFEVPGTVHIRVQGFGRARVSPAPFDPTRRTRAPERTEKLRPLTESGNRHSGTENQSKAGIVGLRARKIGVRATDRSQIIGTPVWAIGSDAPNPNRGSAHDDPSAFVLERPPALVG